MTTNKLPADYESDAWMDERPKYARCVHCDKPIKSEPTWPAHGLGPWIHDGPAWGTICYPLHWESSSLASPKEIPS